MAYYRHTNEGSTNMETYTATPVRHPNDVFADLRAIARHPHLIVERDLPEVVEIICEFVESMEAYQAVIYQP